MKHITDSLYFDTILSSKELDSNTFAFLKSGSESIYLPVTLPETWLCDILLDKNLPLEEFVQLFKNSYATTGMLQEEEDGKVKNQKSDILPAPFTCAVIQNNFTDLPNNTQFTRDSFEQTLHGLIKIEKRIIWQWICDSTIIMVLWGSLKDAENTIRSILDYAEKVLTSPSCAGAAIFPMDTNWNTSPEQTIYNAVKALDHAAFFAAGTLVFFDDVTQNIFGDRLYHLGKSEEAADEYRKGLDINPENINLLNSLGVCYSVMNHPELAREQFERAIGIDDTDFMMLYNAGLTCNLLDDLDKGIEHIKKATALNSSLYDAELTAGILLIKADRPDEAITHLHNAARLNPKSAMTCRIMGNTYLQRAQPKKAAQEYSRAIKLNPWDAGAISGLARAYEVQNKNLDIALNLACHSLVIAPDNPYFRIRLGRIYLKKGDFGFANIEFSKAEKHLRKPPEAIEVSRQTDTDNTECLGQSHQYTA